MSISNQTDKIYGNGNGVTVTFSFPFKIFDATQLLVYLINISTGAVTGPLVLNTDYSVSINPTTEGGSVTFTVAPATGYQWFIKRSVPYTQSAVIPSEGVFPGQQFENQLDLMTMMVIQGQEAISRTLQFPATYTGSIPTVPLPQAGLALGWDPVTSQLVNLMVTAVGTIAVPIANVNLQQLVSAGLVSGAALTLLANIPSGAGIIPLANLPTGTTANKLLLLNGSAKIPAVDGSLITNLTISGLFGSPVSKTIGTIYQAATDGIVEAYAGCSTNPTNLNVAGISDSNSNPSTILVNPNFGSDSLGNVHWYNAVTFKVRKGDYYKVTATSDVTVDTKSMFFTPLGV